MSTSLLQHALELAGGAAVLQLVPLVERLLGVRDGDLLRHHQRAAADLEHLPQRQQRTAARRSGPVEAPPIAKARFWNTASCSSPRSRTSEIQSMVFFSSGVIEALYSGLAMNTPRCAAKSA